jgi:heat shock protein HtpX
MRRYHLQRALHAAKLSPFEEHLLLAGPFLFVAAVVAAFAGGDLGGLSRVIASVGLGGFVLCAASRAARLRRAGMAASLPTSVANVRVRARPICGFNLATAALALVLPLAAGVAVVALFEPGWFVMHAVLLLGCVAVIVIWARGGTGEPDYAGASAAAEGLLQRLCMRADMQAPKLVVEPGRVANSWTAGGELHVTTSLLELLDDAELEAVLAHELAHIAHRDAAAMEICSAPSRVLLAFGGFFGPRLVWLTRQALGLGQFGFPVVIANVAVLCLIPPAFVIGWVSRLSVLGMSRAREFSADAAAATLTGRPSALASALLKLERQREWAPRSDLRQVEAYAVLCVVGTPRSGLARLFATHPPAAARVRRLEEIESRLQSQAARL